MNRYRKWILKKRWEAFGASNRRIRELEVALAEVDPRWWPHEYELLAQRLDDQQARSERLRNHLTSEV